MKPFLLLVTALMLAPLSFAEAPYPTVLTQPSPEFPEVARKQSHPVDVTVAFVIDESGTPKQIRVVHSTQRDFEKSAADAISHWRFQPAKTSHRKTNARMTASFTFHPDQTITSEIKPR